MRSEAWYTGARSRRAAHEHDHPPHRTLPEQEQTIENAADCYPAAIGTTGGQILSRECRKGARFLVRNLPLECPMSRPFAPDDFDCSCPKAESGHQSCSVTFPF